jgi:hypothetical protein
MVGIFAVTPLLQLTGLFPSLGNVVCMTTGNPSALGACCHPACACVWLQHKLYRWDKHRFLLFRDAVFSIVATLLALSIDPITFFKDEGEVAHEKVCPWRGCGSPGYSPANNRCLSSE